MARTPTILIADDDRNVLQLLKMYVRPLGCEVLTAIDGEQALEIAQKELPDVVLLDVLMPKKTGWEVCQALKAVQRTSAISVVLITGKGEVRDRLTGLQVGADDYLVKPFNRDEVVKRIENLLQQQQTRHEQTQEPAENSVPLEELLQDRATNLPTIPLVLNRVKEILIDQEELGIIFVDIEQFEAIEADYGWAFFDEFLCNVGQVIERETEQLGPAIAAADRVGGMAFYIFIETKRQNVDDEKLDEIAEKLRQRLMRSLRTRFSSMRSGQIAFFAGTTRVQYEPQIRLERQIYNGLRRAADAVRDAEQQRKRQLTRELRDIIRNRQVKTLFQPIARASDGQLFGYEILTRGPENSSFRNSDMLFSFARDNQLSWALEVMALESSRERLTGMDLQDKKILINLEAEMFESKEFRLHDLLSFFGSHSGTFVFELTERAAIEDYDAFRKLLGEFREKGIEIAIDDAGSGYASLEAIASLQPDYLKITKGLVSALAKEPIKQDLIKMLVELSKKIGSKTIAEGIETREEYEWCSRLGIDLLQGYYIARPNESFVRSLDIPHFERRRLPRVAQPDAEQRVF